MTLSGCANVPIKNQEWCGDKGPLGATCFNTLNKNSRKIAPEVWNKIAVGPDHRFGKVCTDASNFADTKSTILKLCEASKRCTYDVRHNVVRFEGDVQTFYKSAKASTTHAQFIQDVQLDLLFQHEGVCQ